MTEAPAQASRSCRRRLCHGVETPQARLICDRAADCRATLSLIHSHEPRPFDRYPGTLNTTRSWALSAIPCPGSMRCFAPRPAALRVRGSVAPVGRRGPGWRVHRYRERPERAPHRGGRDSLRMTVSDRSTFSTTRGRAATTKLVTGRIPSAARSATLRSGRSYPVSGGFMI